MFEKDKRDRESERKRETERQTGKETERQVDREADGGLTDRNREIQTETRKKKRQADIQKQANKQTLER